MRRTILFLLTALSLAGLSQCSEKPGTPAAPPGRNMFGRFVPRGLIKTSEGLAPGYVMYVVPGSGSTYLVDRDGQVVHEWKASFSAFFPYLMDDGSVYVGVNDPDFAVFNDAGPYGRIQRISWEGKILWSYELANDSLILHHDIAIKPNGNILALVYEVISYDEAMALGRAPHLTPLSGPWMEKVIEIEPEGERGGKIVWEWRLADHLIQDWDQAKANYGDPALHPERVDYNLGDTIPAPISLDSLEALRAAGRDELNQTRYSLGSDLYHFNAINYNPALGQIAISSPEMSEIFILDQSTTTEEAASHHGGKSGRGGDLLYRWGNPQNYRHGDSTAQKLLYQHDVRWIEPGKPGAGRLTVFNNNAPNLPDSVSYSTVLEIETPLQADGTYRQEPDGHFGPDAPSWRYMAPDTLSFYASFISGAHRMENGNTFINAGTAGRFFEVTPAGEIVWEYWNPYRGQERQLNGDPMNIMPMVYWVFRATFVPVNHPALSGRELEPMDPQPEPFVMQPPPEKTTKD